MKKKTVVEYNEINYGKLYLCLFDISFFLSKKQFNNFFPKMLRFKQKLKTKLTKESSLFCLVFLFVYFIVVYTYFLYIN